MRINPAHRALIVPDRLGAVIAAGTEKIRSGYGNGDAILVAPRHRVFAVADATERFPTASRGLLTRLADQLDRHGPPASAPQWLNLINQVYAGQHYNHKTTLSCIALKRKARGLTLFVIHGGDSHVILFNRASNTIEYTSSPDMRFAGRFQELLRVGELQLERQPYLLLLASDGLSDLLHLAGQSLLEFIPSNLIPPHHLPAAVARILAHLPDRAEHDDLALLALDPFAYRLLRRPPCILGGTSALEETSFQKDLRAGRLPDQWLSAEDESE